MSESESMAREEAIAAIANRLIQASEKVSSKSEQEIESLIDLDEGLKDILRKAKEEIEKYDIDVEEVMSYMAKKRPDMISEFNGTASTEEGMICTVRSIEMDDDEKYIFKSAPMEIRARIVNGLATSAAITAFKHAVKEFGTMPCIFLMTVEKNLSFKITQGFPSYKNKGKEELLEKTIEALSEKVSEGSGAVIEIRRILPDKVRMVVKVENDGELAVTNVHYFKCSENGEDMSTEAMKSFDDGYAHNKWISVQLCESRNSKKPKEDSGEEQKTPTANKFKNRLNEIGG